MGKRAKKGEGIKKYKLPVTNIVMGIQSTAWGI